MTRFLRYSLERGRKIRTVYSLEGKILQKTVLVLAWDENTVTLQSGKKPPVTIPMRDLLACGYARGDDGEE